MKHATMILVVGVLASAGCGGGEIQYGESQGQGPTAGTERGTRSAAMHEHHGGGMHGHAGGMPGPGMRGGSETARACPMQVAGAQVSVGEIDGGAALTFTTDRAEDVEDLRARVRAMASMHERHANMMRGRRGGMGAMPAATASVIDVPNGARLELRATDAADVDALRGHATMQAERMRGRRACPMMTQRPPRAAG